MGECVSGVSSAKVNQGAVGYVGSVKSSNYRLRLCLICMIMDYRLPIMLNNLAIIFAIMSSLETHIFKRKKALCKLVANEYVSDQWLSEVVKVKQGW